MAKKAQLTETIPVRVTPELKARITAVADRAELWASDIVRDCVGTLLPGIEVQLGLRTLDDLTPEELGALGLERAPAEFVKEDRSVGCFGGPPAPRVE